jgi:uncharacterized Zn-finger protein
MEKEILKDLFCHRCQVQLNGKFVHNQHLSLVHKHDSDLKSKSHVAFVHEGKKPYECAICSGTFSTKSYLKIHLASVHEGKKPYQCDICSATFSNKGNLKKHTYSVHEGKKPLKCEFCDYSCAFKKDLRKH